MEKNGKTASIVLIFLMLMQLMSVFVSAASTLPVNLQWGSDDNGYLPSELVFTVPGGVEPAAYKLSLYKNNSLINAQLSELHGDDITGEQADDFAEDIIENGSGSYRVKIGTLENSINDYDYENSEDVPTVEETELSEAFNYIAPSDRYASPQNLKLNNNILSYDYDNREHTYHNIITYAYYSNGEKFQCGSVGSSQYEERDITKLIEIFNRRITEFEKRDSSKYDKTKVKMLIEVTVRPWNILVALPSSPAYMYVDGTDEEITFEEEKQLITVKYNNEAIVFDQQPIIEEGRTLVPLRAIFEKIGADVKWNEETQTVTAAKGDTRISLTINNTTSYKNGQAITLDVPAKVVNGRTLVPVRFVADCFDVGVDWVQDTQTVLLTSK